MHTNNRKLKKNSPREIYVIEKLLDEAAGYDLKNYAHRIACRLPSRKGQWNFERLGV